MLGRLMWACWSILAVPVHMSKMNKKTKPTKPPVFSGCDSSDNLAAQDIVVGESDEEALSI